MIVNVYSIFDEKAKMFSNPFYLPHNGQALRAFGDTVQDEKSQIHKHPGDYKLYKLGEFNDESGLLVSEKQPEFLAHAVDFLDKKG